MGLRHGLRAHIQAAKKRDQARCGNIGKYVWPNNYVGATHADEVRFLKYWLRKRLAWLDANEKGSCPAVPAPPAVSPIALPPGAPVTGRRPVDQPSSAPAFVPVDRVPDDPALAMWACPPG